jgi:hypothetical protein
MRGGRDFFMEGGERGTKHKLLKYVLRYHKNVKEEKNEDERIV